MLYKQTAQQIKGLDESKGVITAFANVYGNKDADGDISKRGCFKKTVKEQRKRIRVLKDHISTQMLGIPLEMDADDPKGLKTVTQFNLEKDLAKDMFTDIKLMVENDLNAELSIGYEVMQRNEENKAEIEEYKLFEYSFLSSWAANEMATVQGIKNLKTKQGAIELLTKAYDLDYSDPRLKEIESILKTLESEPVKSTPDFKPFDVINNYITNQELKQQVNNYAKR